MNLASFPWIIATIIFVLLIVYLVASKGKKHKMDFRSLFILGICLMPVGIATDNYALITLGFLYMILGLANKKNWKEKPDWNKLSKKQKRFKLWILFFFGLIVLGLFILLLVVGNV